MDGAACLASVQLKGKCHEAEAARMLRSSLCVRGFDEVDPLNWAAVGEHGFDVLSLGWRFMSCGGRRSKLQECGGGMERDAKALSFRTTQRKHKLGM